MKSWRVWAVVFTLGFGVRGIARAQPQDDAALADEPTAKNAWPLSGRGAPAAAQQETEAEPPLTTAQLRQRYPDLELRVTPPPTLTLLVPTAIYPFQTLGIGLGFDMYALPRLRLSAIMAIGGSIGGVNGRWEFSAYGELGVGVAVLRWPGQAVARLPSPAALNFRSKRSAGERFILGEESPPEESFFHAIVPASHSLEVEVGALSGHYPLYRCTENCTGEPGVSPTKESASVQATLIYAGLRYVYYRSARSARPPLSSLAGFEAAVDALNNPFSRPAPEVFNLSDHHPSHDPVGVRVKLGVPALKCSVGGSCLGVDLMGGYLPSPASAMFSVNATLR